jgi:hypothetical protein
VRASHTQSRTNEGKKKKWQRKYWREPCDEKKDYLMSAFHQILFFASFTICTRTAVSAFIFDCR